MDMDSYISLTSFKYWEDFVFDEIVAKIFITLVFKWDKIVSY